MGFTSIANQDDTIISLDRADTPGILVDISMVDMDHVDMN